jgi:hypothetical protein
MSGKTYSELDSPIAAQIFLDATSAKETAVAVRKHGFRDNALRRDSLMEQAYPLDYFIMATNREALRRRADTLTSWMIDEASGAKR